MNPKLLNGSVLTYIGDSYYEHEIRSYLVGEGLTKLNDLHQEAIKYTSGKAQAKIIKYLLEDNLLTEEEINIYKRGRNITITTKKNFELNEIHDSNGFEALIGYLSLTNINRVKEIINYAIAYIKEHNGQRK
ncbi:MAG TPA: Mini-ribonuclease 3 [Acholeplasma sp.]|jgi:ribonuclease-3 family protein|nr:Mini-ribonuclease 3 [Acholeplasma sp.]